MSACIEKGREAKIAPDRAPVVNREIVSETLELTGDSGEKYFGKIGVIRVEGGFRSLVYIWRYSKAWEELGTPFCGLYFLIFLE